MKAGQLFYAAPLHRGLDRPQDVRRVIDRYRGGGEDGFAFDTASRALSGTGKRRQGFSICTSGRLKLETNFVFGEYIFPLMAVGAPDDPNYFDFCVQWELATYVPGSVVSVKNSSGRRPRSIPIRPFSGQRLLVVETRFEDYASRLEEVVALLRTNPTLNEFIVLNNGDLDWNEVDAKQPRVREITRVKLPNSKDYFDLFTEVLAPWEP